MLHADAPTRIEWLALQDKGTTDMNKVILPVAVLLAAAAAYLFYTSQTADGPEVAVETPAVETQPAPAPETTEETVEEAVDEATEEAAEVGQAMQDAAADAVDATQDAARDAAEAVEEQVGNAVDAATEMANDAATAIGQAADEASEAASNVANDAATALAPETEAVSSETSPAGTATTGTALTDAEAEVALSAETFDYDRAVQVIDNSDISETQKTMLKSGLDQARNNPALLENLLQQARTALGL